MSGTESATPSLSRSLNVGLALSLLNTVLSRAGLFLLGVVLARLLAPEEFGVYATALVVQTLLVALNEIGSAAAVIRREGDPTSMLPTAWTLSLAWSVVGFTAAFLCAPLIASALGSPEAGDLLRLMSVSILLDGFAAVPGAMLARELRQGRRLIADVVGMALNIGVTAVLAVTGHGAWSLAIGNVAGTTLVVVLLITLSRQWPRLGWSRTEAGEVVRYGLVMIGSSALLVAAQGAPVMMAGSVLGATAVGFFYLANNVANWPVSIMSTTLERTALPTFARVREAGGDLSASFAGLVGLVGGAVLVAGSALAVLAEPLVRVVYGDRWLPAAVVVAGLALAAAVRVLAQLVFSILVAMGESVSSIVPQAAWLVAIVVVTPIAGHRWGIAGLGWAQLVVAVLVAVPVHLWCVRRAGLSLTALARGFAAPAAVAVATAALLVGVRLLGLHPFPTLVLGGVVTLVPLVLGYRRLRATALSVTGSADSPLVGVTQKGVDSAPVHL